MIGRVVLFMAGWLLVVALVIGTIASAPAQNASFIRTVTSQTICSSTGGDANDSSSGSGSFFNHNLTCAVPANFITTGRMLLVYPLWSFTTGGTAPTIDIRFRLGGTVIYQGGANTPANNLAARPMGHIFYILCLAVPGAAANTASGFFGNLNQFASTGILNSITTPVALATNTALTLDMGTQWNSAGVGTNTVTLTGLVVQALN